MNFWGQISGAGGYVEFDDIKVFEYAGNILVDGDMEASGSGDWTAGNSANLTKDSGDYYAGANSLSVAYNSVALPYAEQTTLIVGNEYRVTGWAKGDGTVAPRFGTDTANLWFGTTSSTWQHFDLVFTSTGTNVRFALDGSSGSVKFDEISVVATGNLVSDGNMEASGTSEWNVPPDGSLSKETVSPPEGLQYMRISFSGNYYSYMQPATPPFTIGKQYRITGLGRSAGQVAPQLYVHNTGYVWPGGISAEWQPFDVTFTATDGTFSLSCIGPGGTTSGSCDFDHIRVVEAADRPAACSGCCDTPPQDYCLDSNTLMAYEPAGICVYGECEYYGSEIDCPIDCSVGVCN